VHLAEYSGFSLRLRPSAVFRPIALQIMLPPIDCPSKNVAAVVKLCCHSACDSKVLAVSNQGLLLIAGAHHL